MFNQLKVARTKGTTQAAPSSPLDRDAPTDSAYREGPGRHEFSRISVLRPQAKLTVNQPGDAHEQEADLVADRVMSMETSPMVQREPEEEEEQAQRMPAVQRVDDGNLQSADVSNTVQYGLSGGGQPLDSKTRGFMEPRFGHDFSNVRIHSDARASQSADQVAARAYTVGGDIAFRSGEYNPGNSEGKRLLAHELTHVVQQQAHATSSGTAARVQRKDAQQKATEKDLDDAAAAAAKTDAPPPYVTQMTNVGDVSSAKSVLAKVQAATLTLIPANGQPGWGEGVTETHISKNTAMSHTLQNYLMYAGEETRTTGDFQARYKKASTQFARLDGMAKQYLASAPTSDQSDPSKVISTATGFDPDKSTDSATKAGTQFKDLTETAGNGDVVNARNRVKDLSTKMKEIQDSMNTSDRAVITSKKSCAIAADQIEVAANKTKTDPAAPDSADVKKIKDSMEKVKGYVSFAVDKAVDAGAKMVPGGDAAAPALKFGADQLGGLIVDEIYRAELGKAQGVQAEAAASITALGGNIGVLELQKAANEWRGALETQIAKAAEFNKVQSDLRDAIMQMGNAADNAVGPDGKKAPAGGRGYAIMAKFLAESDLYMQDVETALSSGKIEKEMGTEATGAHKDLDVSKDNKDSNADPMYYAASKVGDKYEVIPTFVYLNRGASQSSQGDSGVDKSVELMLKDLEADKATVKAYQTELNKAFGMGDAT